MRTRSLISSVVFPVLSGLMFFACGSSSGDGTDGAASNEQGQGGVAGSGGGVSVGGAGGASAGKGGASAGQAGNGGASAGHAAAGAGGVAGTAGAGGASGAGGKANSGGAAGSAGAAAGTGGSGGSGGAAAGAAGTGTGGSAGVCSGQPSADDAPRKVVISHPYDATGANPGFGFEVLSLATDGTLTQTGTAFDLGVTSPDTEIVFTSDGNVGVAVLDDQMNIRGKLGTFRFDGDAVTVVEAAFDPGVFAGELVMDPSLRRVWVIDSDQQGSISAVDIDCDGHLHVAAQSISLVLPEAMAFLPTDPTRAVVAESGIPGGAGGTSAATAGAATLLSFATLPPTKAASANPFSDTDASLDSLVVTVDGKFALVSDNNGFPSDPSHTDRIGVVSLDAASVSAKQVLTYAPAGKKPLSMPFWMIASPFDDTALVSAGESPDDALFVIAYDGTNAAAPFSISSELSYTTQTPQLPGVMVGARRGMQKGVVLVSEVEGVRVVKFHDGAIPTDESVLEITSLIGSIGIQP